MHSLDVARVCHAANRAYCEALGDYSQKPWEEAPEWQRKSAEDGVRFHTENPSASASSSHENWWASKTADGWKYGLVKDEGKKEHPCCVPFDQLPIAQQLKDVLFRAVVHALTGTSTV